MIKLLSAYAIVGKVSTTVWGGVDRPARASAKDSKIQRPLGEANGPPAGNPILLDGKILYGNDGKYHLYATHWTTAMDSARQEEGRPAEELDPLGSHQATTSWGRTCPKAIAYTKKLEGQRPWGTT